MKILIFGLPGSGKTSLAKPFAELINGVHINADVIRTSYNDWDFSLEGRMRQANRMKYLADGVVMAGKVAVADFICPTEELRQHFNADFTVWMDTIETGRFEDTNAMFEAPNTNWSGVDYHVSKWFDDTHIQLAPIVERFMKKKSTTTVGYSVWRLEQEENNV